MELAEAAILCSADKARIVFIKDQFEDNFVRIMLQKAYLSSAGERLGDIFFNLFMDDFFMVSNLFHDCISKNMSFNVIKKLIFEAIGK